MRFDSLPASPSAPEVDRNVRGGTRLAAADIRASGWEAAMRQPSRALAVLVVVVVLAGCRSAGGASDTRQTAGPSSTYAAGSPARERSAGASSGPAAPAPGSTPPAGAPPTGCQAGTVTVSWAPDRPSPQAVCVRVRSEITVVLAAPQLHEWTPPASSDTGVAAVTTFGANQEGTMYATVIAARAGTTVLTAVAQPREGADDPRPVPWRLAVTVVA